MICICGCFTGLLVTVSVYYVVKVATIHSNNKKIMQIYAWQRAHNSYNVLRIIQIIMFVLCTNMSYIRSPQVTVSYIQVTHKSSSYVAS